MRILVVEDEPALQQQVRAELEAQGYTVDSTGEGKEALYLATEYPYDAAIVDIGLPGLSGLDIIARLRKRGSHLPILVLTARGALAGQGAGPGDRRRRLPDQTVRDGGAAGPAQGVAAARSRRGQEVLHCGPITLNLGAQKVAVGGKEVELTSYEYRLLEHLVRERRRVLSKDELAAHLYPHDEERDSNVIEVLIGRLRRKLDPDGKLQPLETLRGRGYRFTLGD